MIFGKKSACNICNRSFFVYHASFPLTYALTKYLCSEHLILYKYLLDVYLVSAYIKQKGKSTSWWSISILKNWHYELVILNSQITLFHLFVSWYCISFFTQYIFCRNRMDKKHTIQADLKYFLTLYIYSAHSVILSIGIFFHPKTVH